MGDSPDHLPKRKQQAAQKTLKTTESQGAHSPPASDEGTV